MVLQSLEDIDRSCAAQIHYQKILFIDFEGLT
jgi:hypothetical protein